MYTSEIIWCGYRTVMTHLHVSSFVVVTHFNTHFTLALVQMMYSISSEKGFWKVKELVLIQIHSRDLEWNRNITDRTWPRSFTTYNEYQKSLTNKFRKVKTLLWNLFSKTRNFNLEPSMTRDTTGSHHASYKHTCWRLSLSKPWSSGCAKSRMLFPSNSCHNKTLEIGKAQVFQLP